MGTQAYLNIVARGELVGVVALVVIGGALIALAPAQAGGSQGASADA
jgi:hypothetical protein